VGVRNLFIIHAQNRITEVHDGGNGFMDMTQLNGRIIANLERAVPFSFAELHENSAPRGWGRKSGTTLQAC
jgi:hypothetical protein